MSIRVRLQALLDMIPSQCIMADIGTDHGLLPIMAVKEGKCLKAYACDINKGPLERAKQAIIEARLEEKVIPMLCDGLEQVQPDVDVVVIAGMGFDTIVHILETSLPSLQKFRKIILQCNGHVELLRKWLSDHHCIIDEERIVKDHHYYQMISMHISHAQTKPLTDEECLFGTLATKDPLFPEYWEHQLVKKRNIIANMPKQQKNYKELQSLIINIEEKLKH